MIVELIKIAFNNLGSNKLRSFLSMLGIIIGVSAVIAIISIGQGATYRIRSRVSSLGSGLIIVSPGFKGGKAGKVSTEVRDVFSLELAADLAKGSPDVEEVVPSINSGALLKYKDNNYQARMVATTPGYIRVLNCSVERGRFLLERDVEGFRKVAVIGQGVASELFPGEDPLGKKIIAYFGKRRLIFEVVGVLAHKGQMMFFNFDEQIYVPITTVMKRAAGKRYVDLYLIQAKDADKAESAAMEVEFLLTRKLKDPDLFRIRSQEEVIETVKQITSTMILMLAGIAGISLVVGGIGIMNIMLVSVTERTREIGIRKALGAKRSDILLQFLIEASVISFIGGVVGLFLGWIVSAVVSHFTGWPIIISPLSIILAFGFSVGIGLIFGIYPARKAALLNPVEALRYE